MLDPLYPNRVMLPEGMISGLYKYIVFDRVERSTGKVYDEPCHRLLGHDVTCRIPTGSLRTTGAHRCTIGRRTHVACRDGRAMRVLVTGGSGFIGSHVLDALASRGDEPVGFDLVPSRHHPPGLYATIVGDLTDREATRRAVRGCDVVIHLAAVADVSEVVADPVRADRVNVHGTQMILEAARREGIDRVIYGSTIWVYGDAPTEEPDEDSLLVQPTHLYTATKLAGEMYVRSYNSLYGGKHTVLRFGIPYGPRARPAAVVPSLVMRAQRGEALTIAGDGRQTRQFVYVDDLAQGIVASLTTDAGGRTYNLVGAETTSVREIADLVRASVALVAIVHGPERPADIRLGRVSGERAGLSSAGARHLFSDGLRRYVDWLTGTIDSARGRRGLEHERQRGDGPAPGIRRAVMVRVVQQHDVAAAEIALSREPQSARGSARDPIAPPT